MLGVIIEDSKPSSTAPIAPAVPPRSAAPLRASYYLCRPCATSREIVRLLLRLPWHVRSRSGGWLDDAVDSTDNASIL